MSAPIRIWHESGRKFVDLADHEREVAEAATEVARLREALDQASRALMYPYDPTHVCSIKAMNIIHAALAAPTEGEQ